MAKFKKLTLGRMPRVFVAILAMDDGGRGVTRAILEALRGGGWAQHREFTARTDAAILHGILELPKDERIELVPLIDEALEDLAGQDFFGTEGQIDPRGDRRG